MRLFSKKSASNSSIAEAAQARFPEFPSTAGRNFLSRENSLDAQVKKPSKLSKLRRRTFKSKRLSVPANETQPPRRRGLLRRLFSRKHRHDSVTEDHDSSKILSENLPTYISVPSVKAVTQSGHSKPSSVLIPQPYSSFKPFGTPAGTTYEAFQHANMNIFSTFEPKSFRVKPCKVSSKTSRSKPEVCSSTFELKPFKLRKVPTADLKWKPTSTGSGMAAVPRTIDVYEVSSPQALASAKTLPFPEYAASIPLVHKELPDATSLSLFQALQFAHQLKRDSQLAQIVEDIVNIEVTRFLSADTDSLRMNQSTASIATHQSQDSPSDSSSAFAACAHSSHTSALSSSCRDSKPGVSNRSSRARRLLRAFDRLKSRWHTRNKLLRQYRREKRNHRHLSREAKRKVKVEQRRLRILEEKQHLLQLSFRVVEAADRNDQTKRDHRKAARQRKLDAEVADSKRKLESLQPHARLTDENRKAAAAIKKSLQESEALVGESYLKAGSGDVSPQASASDSSLLGPQTTQSTSKTTLPGIVSHTASTCTTSNEFPHYGGKYAPAPLMMINGCINPEELEINHWKLGIGAEIREMFAKERPVLGIPPVVRPPKAVASPSSSSSSLEVSTEAPATSSEAAESSPCAPASSDKNLDATCSVPVTGNDKDANALVSVTEVPVVKRRIKTPFWETSVWKTRRVEVCKALDKGAQFVYCQEEIDSGKANLRPTGVILP